MCSVCSMCCIVLFCVVRMRVWCRKVVPACVCAFVVLIVLCVCVFHAVLVLLLLAFV